VVRPRTALVSRRGVCPTWNSPLALSATIQPPHSANRHDAGCGGVGDHRGVAIVSQKLEPLRSPVRRDTDMNTIAKSVTMYVSLYLMPSIASAMPVVVFDSLGTPGGDICCAGVGPETGASIALVGGPRQVTKFETNLSSTGFADFQIRFYDLSNTGQPATVLWESQTFTFPKDPRVPYNSALISVAVPGIRVPDSFAWTVARPSTSIQLDINAEPSATIGTQLSLWSRNPFSQQWQMSTFGALMARVTAIPEPTTACMCALLAMCMGRTRMFRLR
jgi:hypothetical protein